MKIAHSRPLLNALASIGLLLSASSVLASDGYFAVVPIKAISDLPSDISLRDGTLPDGRRGQAYSFNFSEFLSVKKGETEVGKGNVEWSVASAMPLGLHFSGSSLSGTPQEKISSNITLKVSLDGKEAMGVYALKVGGKLLSGATHIARGATSACAALESSSVYCWGESYNGALGLGSVSKTPTPTKVAGLPAGKIKELAGSQERMCALIETDVTDSLYCWGSGSGNKPKLHDTAPKGAISKLNGEQPARVAYVNAGEPFEVDTPPKAINYTGELYHDIVEYGIGYWHRTFVKADGRVGVNGTAMGGATSTTPVPGLPGKTVSVVSGLDFSCSLSDGGAVYCWTNPSFTTLGYAKAPRQVPELDSGVTAVAAGYENACAIQQGALKCWGRSMGFDFKKTSIPSTVGSGWGILHMPGLESGVTAVDLALNGGCAIKNTNVYCWGQRLYLDVFGMDYSLSNDIHSIEE